MSNSTPAADRRTAYAVKFGSAHPSDAVVLAWAKEVFPGRELKFRRGLFKCQAKEQGKTITRHLQLKPWPLPTSRTNDFSHPANKRNKPKP